MKAALEAAAMIEERVDGFEAVLNALQDTVGTLGEERATKADVEVMEQRLRGVQQDMAGTVAQKADLEQLSQCVQAIRHELMSTIKRKANSELVESSVQAARQELLEIVSLKLSKDEVAQLVQEQVQVLQRHTETVQQQVQKQVQALRSEICTMMQERLDASRLEVTDVQEQVHAVRRDVEETLSAKADTGVLDQHLQIIRRDLEHKADLQQVTTQVLSHVQTVRGDLLGTLVSKVDKEALEEMRLQVHVLQEHFSEALSGKADKEALSGKMDKEQVDEQVQSVQHVLVESLDAKVDMEKFEARIKTLWESVNTKLGQEQLDCLQQRLGQISTSKADKEIVEDCAANVQDLEVRLSQVESSKADKDAVEGCIANVQSLERGLAQLASCKVDTEKVVELVEAVREEVSGTVKQTMANSEQVQQKLQVLDQYDLANLDCRITERIEQRSSSMRQELLDVAVSKADERVEAAREEFTELVSRKPDAEQVVKMMQSIQSESIGGSTHSGGSRRSSDAGQVSSAASSVAESASLDWVESLMEQRMRLVKAQLTKLVDIKVDAEQMNVRIQEAQQEITSHVDRRVDAAQQKLSLQVGQIAEQVGTMSRRMEQVEKHVHNLDSVSAQPDHQEAVGPCWDFDNSRTARVRQLLTQLVEQTAT